MSPIHSSENHRYYVIFIDHYTRFTWLFPLKRKSEVKSTFIAFKELVENRLQLRVGTLFSDNGGEYVALRDYLAYNGISHLTSPPHTPEHNGLAERKHRHIVEMGPTLLSQSSMPKEYWQYALAASVYLINRLPTPVLAMESPYTKLFQQTPNYEKLRIFGCACYPWLRPYAKHKLDDRSLQCIFMGYSHTQNAYLCLHPRSGRVYTSRHVMFDEQTFPFRDQQPSQVVNDSNHTQSCPPSSSVQVPCLIPPPVNGTPDSDLHLPAPSPPTHTTHTQLCSPLSLPSSPPYSSSEHNTPLQNGPEPVVQTHPVSPEPTAPPQNELPPTTQPLNSPNRPN